MSNRPLTWVASLAIGITAILSCGVAGFGAVACMTEPVQTPVESALLSPLVLVGASHNAKGAAFPPLLPAFDRMRFSIPFVSPTLNQER